MGEDESHSGDGSVDLFTEEELLPLRSSFRSGARPWPVSAKPKTPTEDITKTQDVLKAWPEKSFAVLKKMLNKYSALTLAKAFQATAESLTKPRAVQFSTTTENLRVIWPTAHTTLQTLPGIEEKREETTSQMTLNTESASGHLKIKSNSASSEMRGNTITSTAAAIISQSEKTFTEQNNTETFSRENFTLQANEQTTSGSLSLTTQRQRDEIPETYSTTSTDDGSRTKTDAEMSATTTESGSTGTNIILTASHVNEDEIKSSTTASMTTNTLVNNTTTATTGKRRKHSTSVIKKQQGPKQTFVRNGKDEDVQEKPQRQRGKHLL